MKYKMLHKIMIFLLVIAMVVPYTAVQAKSNIKTKKLSPDKNYYYDLDGDGKKEKIKYIEKRDNDILTVTLYVNDIKKYTKKLDYAVTAGYTIADLNGKDKYLDLFLSITGDSYCLKYAAFQRYEAKTIKDISTNINNPLLWQTRGYDITEVDGKGNFSIVVDTPFSLPPIGCYYCKVPLTIKGKKITKKNTDTFSYVNKEYKFILTRNIKLYEKSSTSAKVLRTIKKGEIIRISKIKINNSKKYLASGKDTNGYAYIIDKNGKKGWIYLNKKIGTWASGKTMFEEVPGWG